MFGVKACGPQTHGEVPTPCPGESDRCATMRKTERTGLLFEMTAATPTHDVIYVDAEQYRNTNLSALCSEASTDGYISSNASFIATLSIIGSRR